VRNTGASQEQKATTAMSAQNPTAEAVLQQAPEVDLAGVPPNIALSGLHHRVVVVAPEQQCDESQGEVFREFDLTNYESKLDYLCLLIVLYRLQSWNTKWNCRIRIILPCLEPEQEENLALGTCSGSCTGYMIFSNM
jgi:hypothetical protein